MTRTADKDAKPAKSASRAERLAAALRENLRRRKAQARGAAALATIGTKDGKAR